jgi:hypothetical protein
MMKLSFVRVFPLCAMILLAGCRSSTSSGSSAGTQPPGTETSASNSTDESSNGTVVSDGAAVVDPETLMLLPDDRALLTAVEDALTAKCMQAAGFEYSAVALSTAEASARGSEEAFKQNFPFTGDSSVSYASVGPEAVDSTNVDYLSSLSPAEQERYNLVLAGDWDDTVEVDLNGSPMATPRSGCISEARVAMYGSLEDALISQFFVGNLRNLALGNTMADPTVAAAIESWVACMGSAGFSFQSFAEARSYAYSNSNVAGVVAQADADCVAQGSLGSTFSSVYNEQLVSQIEAYQGYLEDVAASTAAALAVARGYA